MVFDSIRVRSYQGTEIVVAGYRSGSTIVFADRGGPSDWWASLAATRLLLAGDDCPDRWPTVIAIGTDGRTERIAGRIVAGRPPAQAADGRTSLWRVNGLCDAERYFVATARVTIPRAFGWFVEIDEATGEPVAADSRPEFLVGA